jgi:uncharacterized membrane protein YdjX (TVP38/TMEM64 family)
MSGPSGTLPSSPPPRPFACRVAGRAPGPGSWSGRRLAVLAVLVSCAVILLSAPSLHASLIHAIDAVGELIRRRPAVGMLAFVLLAAVSAMVAFVSSAVLIPVAVHVWGASLCALLLWLGWFLGGVAAYAVGRYFGRPIVERLVSPATVARYEVWACSSAALTPMLLAQLALPSDAAGYIFGIVRCRPAVFLAALALAEVPYAVGAVYLGVSFLERDLVTLFVLGLAGIALSAWALARVHRHHRAA